MKVVFQSKFWSLTLVQNSPHSEWIFANTIIKILQLHKKVTVSFWILGFVFNLEYHSQLFLKFKKQG